MSKYYTALVSNEGLDAVRSDFKIIVKADSLAQARAGVASRILEVERATDQEIFEAGKNGNAVLNLSDDGTDEGQLVLPCVDETKTEAAMGAPHFTAHGLVGATASGSAPAWLPTGRGESPAVDTGD